MTHVISGQDRSVPALDAVDRLLLDALLADGRAPYAELARRVGLSAPAVRDRIDRLEAAGIVTGYRAVVDPHAVGLEVTALVGIYQSDSAESEDVVRSLESIREVEDCWFVAGEEAFVVKVRVPDTDALGVLLGTLRRVPGVSRTVTTVVLSTRWEGRRHPALDPEPAARDGPDPVVPPLPQVGAPALPDPLAADVHAAFPPSAQAPGAGAR